MNKSKEFFESQIEKFDNDYWNFEEKFNNLEKEMESLKYRLASYSDAMLEAKRERDFYQELLDDLISNE